MQTCLCFILLANHYLLRLVSYVPESDDISMLDLIP